MKENQDEYIEYDVFFTMKGINYHKNFMDKEKAEKFYKSALSNPKYSNVYKKF